MGWLIFFRFRVRNCVSYTNPSQSGALPTELIPNIKQGTLYVALPTELPVPTPRDRVGLEPTTHGLQGYVCLLNGAFCMLAPKYGV